MDNNKTNDKFKYDVIKLSTGPDGREWFWPAASKVTKDKLKVVKVHRWDRQNFVTFKVGCFVTYEEAEKWFDVPGRLQKLKGQGYKTFFIVISGSRP